MIIERFKGGDPAPIGERFQRDGRMLPQGVTYHASWVDLAGLRCFQIMEAPDPHALDRWIGRWNDLIDFEIVPVATSSEFWSQVRPDQA